MGKEDINLNRIENSTDPAFCGWQGCRVIGKFRAPISRQNLNQFYWFCLEHVRLYNSNWNYCEGMSEQCFEDSYRADATWNRPTWPMTSGNKISGYNKSIFLSFDTIFDPFDFVEQGGTPSDDLNATVSYTEKRALRLLGLEFPVPKEEVKARYKVLVKRHHPDRHGGDKDSEEMLKKINEAYETIMNLCVA